MVLLIVLLALIAWAVVGTVIELRRDGFHPTPTDWSRVAGRDAQQHAESGHVYR
ncbi:hypothetical protein [Microbacterium sp. EST19A]|uniref:hypothetical protein n=1 Tax=Microbacterium sp. EST19A TaxID=2862681 RepID=UPI001CC063D9|nr:hypothetical protein [Microbacterium sp. EST19A]